MDKTIKFISMFRPLGLLAGIGLFLLTKELLAVHLEDYAPLWALLGAVLGYFGGVMTERSKDPAPPQVPAEVHAKLMDKIK